MTTLFATTIREIGVEAPELFEKGVLILFEVGAPPELAEVSVLHEKTIPAGRAPVPGDSLRIGARAFPITAVGSSAWQKVGELGHVVFSFNASPVAERPGEICVTAADAATLGAILVPGAALELVGRD